MATEGLFGVTKHTGSWVGWVWVPGGGGAGLGGGGWVFGVVGGAVGRASFGGLFFLGFCICFFLFLVWCFFFVFFFFFFFCFFCFLFT